MDPPWHSSCVLITCSILRRCVADRNFREYEDRAGLYIQEAVDQLADYTGACWTSPEGLGGGWSPGAVDSDAAPGVGSVEAPSASAAGSTPRRSHELRWWQCP